MSHKSSIDPMFVDNELRGGMDASEYKDYVLTLLLMKYVSDKFKADPDSLIEVPEGASFNDMVA